SKETLQHFLGFGGQTVKRVITTRMRQRLRGLLMDLPPPGPAETAMLERILDFAPKAEGLSVPFLTWDECRVLQEAGMTIAPHTRSHRNLTHLAVEEVRQELRHSREDIAHHLGRDVRHIACPVGRPHWDFRPEVEPVVAEEEGFASFITSERGANRAGDNPYRIRRDHLCACWGDYQVKYFFSRPWRTTR
uniref:polysaccharide deacetylase family protein n=1 Tax=Candidatus Magnetaquicoccus inordinatus TaxID=2496818 RepID=UPI001D0EA9F0